MQTKEPAQNRLKLQKELILTSDGSHTFFVPGLGESYHSVHGAIQESGHVFIESGLKMMRKKSVRIFEIGFGSGLNALLSWDYANTNSCHIFYNTIEMFPLETKEASQFNYPDLLEVPRKIFMALHEVEWEKKHKLSPNFEFCKSIADLRTFIPDEEYDLIFFDAFSPDAQPDLWETAIFKALFKAMSPGGILTSYSVRGAFRRSLKEAGFNVEKIPGPPGKRHITRAWKENPHP